MYNLALANFWATMYNDTTSQALTLEDIEYHGKIVAMKEVNRFKTTQERKDTVYKKLISINFEQFLSETRK